MKACFQMRTKAKPKASVASGAYYIQLPHYWITESNPVVPTILFLNTTKQKKSKSLWSAF
jgi:hypothetical protein